MSESSKWLWSMGRDRDRIRRENRHARQEREKAFSLLPPKQREEWQKKQDETQELEAVSGRNK